MSSRRSVVVDALTPARLAPVKRAFTTRRVPEDAMKTVVSGAVRPRPGDVVLAEVTRLGQHARVELPSGRRATLHRGDVIMVAYGDRYAPDQFEGHVPLTLGPTNLVAGGGVAADMVAKSAAVRNATDIRPIGLVGDDRGRVLNLAHFALPAAPPSATRPPTFAVIGTSMNSGKTTTIHHLVHTLSRAGLRPGATKVTGTGSGNDFWVMIDAGAHIMLDFTDAGLATTYLQPMSTVEATMGTLVGHLTAAGSGVNLVEIADGLFQKETARLIESQVFLENVDAVIFAAGEASGAVAGVERLRARGVNVVAASGLMTRSPLAAREAAEIIGIPVLTLADLDDAPTVCGLLGLPMPEPTAQTEDVILDLTTTAGLGTVEPVVGRPARVVL